MAGNRPGVAALRVRWWLAGAGAVLAAQAAFAQEPELLEDAPPGPIIITGTAVPLEAAKLGHALTVIDSETIARSQQPEVLELLRGVPGLAVNQSGGPGALAQLRIRGAEANHALVLVDGVDVSAVSRGEFDLAGLLSAQVERIEVLRGAQSGLYGSNALAGVINIITRGGTAPAFEAALEGGSFGTVTGRAAARLGNAQRFLTLGVMGRSTGGISRAAGGTEPDSDRNLGLVLRGGLDLGPAARLEASLRFMDKASEEDGFDFSGGPEQGLAIDSDDFSERQELSGAVILTIQPQESWVTVLSASYSRDKAQGGAAGLATYGERGQRLRLAGRSSHSFATGAGIAHSLTIFADYEEERFRNTFPFDPSQVPQRQRSLLGLGGEYRMELWDRLTLKGALRHDRNTAFADATTYSLSAAWQVPGSATRFHASYGTGVTNPTFAEQFGFIPGSFVGNPALKPEHARGFDIGVEQRVGQAAQIGLVWFKADLTDEIVNQFPTVLNDAGKSRRQGVELSGQLRLGHVRLSGDYTYLQATDPDGTREVRRPRHQAGAALDADFGPQQRGSLHLGLRYNGRMLDDDFRNFFVSFAPEKTGLDSYLVVRLAGSWRIGERLRLTGRVENLLDARYQEAISYASPGLAAFGGLQLVLP